jgi:hypothetical protein
MFDHVVVRAQIDGKAYWLDGTLPAVVSPGAVPAMPFEWVLPLSKAGSGLEHLPWTPAERPDQVTMFEIDARAGFDKPARIVSTTIKRGLAGLQEEIQLSALTPDQLLGAFRQNAIGETWQAIDQVTWRYDPKAQASVLMISGTGTADWDDDGDGVKSLALPGGGFSPPEKRVRPVDQDQDAPFYNKAEYDCRVTTVRLPVSTRQGQWSHKDDIATRMFGRTYYRAFDLRGGALRMVRGSRIDQREIDAASARQDNGRIASFDNSMAWITFDPNGQRAVVQKARPVPSTDEIDWTADDVPCLPKTAK